MATRRADAVWEGGIKNGKGSMKLGSGAFEGAFSFASRFEEGAGTNPEELIAAAHAGCFSMALSFMLEQAGFPVDRVRTVAKVRIEKVGDGFGITSSALETEAKVPGVDEKTFLEKAEAAKAGCPVSKALAGVDITLKATLLK